MCVIKGYKTNMSNESNFLDKLADVLMHRKLEGCKTANVGGNSCRSQLNLIDF